MPRWCSKYSCTISSVITPVLHAPYPTAQKCLPQYLLRNEGNSSCNSRELRPFNRFPNPATNAVRIIPNGERVAAVRLVSALGQPLPAPLSAGRVDLSALPAGIYYLTIITETTSYQHKIVKQ